jgi:signal transduction histidine kinase
VCVICICLSRLDLNFPREIGLAAVVISGSLLMAISIVRMELDPQADRYISGQIGLALMIGLVTLPLRPLQALGASGLFVAAYVVITRLAGVVLNGAVLTALIAMAPLTTAMAAVVYIRTWEMHKAHADQLSASRELSRSEIRRFVAQNAATMSRMAAALSHELNTPVGALKSSIDTLAALAERRKTTNEVQLTRINALEEQVRRSGREAAARLQEVVLRLQRVTNLDRAEVQTVDLNSLVKDVVYLMQSEAQARQREVQMHLEELPPIDCRPQQLSAVLSNVLTATVESAASTVLVETCLNDGSAEIVFHTTAPQLDAAETQAIFDPGFEELRGRIAAGNWGLFMARQVIRENGGEMRMERGRGFIVSLPVPKPR